MQESQKKKGSAKPGVQIHSQLRVLQLSRDFVEQHTDENH
jgi:hypothetical protein